MRLTRLINSISLKYALGEVLLIVVGITVALSVNSWYSDRQMLSDEVRYLQRISLSLEIDLEAIENTERDMQDAVERLSELTEHLQAKLPYTEDLDAKFGEMAVFYSTNLNVSVYESLQSRGLDLISNDDLQISLIDVYESQYSQLEQTNSLAQQMTLSYTDPHQLERFDVEYRKATPFDYENLLEDRYHNNLIAYRLYVYENFWLKDYRQTIERIRRLIGDITAELALLQ